MIKLICPVCNIEYQKTKSEWTRNESLGRKNYCSLHCFRKANPIQPINRYPIQLHSKNKIDEFSEFRYLYKTIRNNNRRICEVSLKDLKEIWNTQNGICPYSKIKMILPSYRIKCSPTIAASIDRIDSSKPYTRDNIQFVVRAINLMKNSMSSEDTHMFLQTICQNLL